MKKWFITLIASISFFVTAGEVPDIKAEQLLKSDTSKWLILDVRSAEEYAEGHVPGAVNIAHTELEDRLSEIVNFESKPVVVYCRSGYRAGKAAEILKKAKFADIRHLEGDIMGWREAGHEMAK